MLSLLALGATPPDQQTSIMPVPGGPLPNTTGTPTNISRGSELSPDGERRHGVRARDQCAGRPFDVHFFSTHMTVRYTGVGGHVELFFTGQERSDQVGGVWRGLEGSGGVDPWRGGPGWEG